MERKGDGKLTRKEERDKKDSKRGNWKQAERMMKYSQKKRN